MRGEVLRPGRYALVQGMTAAQLVRISGGFKRSALLAEADLASYEIKDEMQVVSRRRNIEIGKAVSGLDPNADVLLKPGDVLDKSIRVSGWNDIGASVTLGLARRYLSGNPRSFRKAKRLSSGNSNVPVGFRTTAYPGRGSALCASR